MSKHETTYYCCESCGKNLGGSRGNVDIVTSKSEANIGWRRLHVVIKLIHGVHNQSSEENADLCQDCAVKLLKDALARVEAGERLSAGTEQIDQQGWKSR